jgi:hypothetical protein
LIASLGGIDANPPSEVSALDLVGGCGFRESFYAASICGKKDTVQAVRPAGSTWVDSVTMRSVAMVAGCFAVSLVMS